MLVLIYSLILNFRQNVHTLTIQLAKKKCFHIIECPSGTYGIYCRETCSVNCNVFQHCNRTKGECFGGCQPGWKGLHCDQRIVAKSFKNTKALLLHAVYNFKE